MIKNNFIILFMTIMCMSGCQQKKEDSAKTRYTHELWNGAYYGMTVKDVKKLHQNEISSKIEYELEKEFILYKSPSRKDTESELLLWLDDYVVLDEKFIVGFFFDNKKLTYIILKLKDLDTEYKGINTFVKYGDALNLKYGRMATSDKNRLYTSGVWISNDIDITLAYENLDKERLNLYVVYQKRISEDLKKI